MTDLNTLKKIIPPDQAVANKALSRGLQQVKEIFNTDLPSLSVAVSTLETNKDLDQITALTEPIPLVVRNFLNTTLATGTGPGNTITVNDVIGTASGNTMNTALPVVTENLQALTTAGALVSLTANTGNPNSAINGVYTVMSYALSNSAPYIGTITDGNGNIIGYTLDLPSNNYLNVLGGSGSFSNFSLDGVIDDAFSGNLIPAANLWITNIASNNVSQANICNQSTDAMAQQLLYNQNNCLAAGLEIGNIVNDLNSANLIANSISDALSLAASLHTIGTDVSEGGAAQFIQAVANTNTLSGQAVVSSLREGRNIAVLNAVGIQLDTQLVDVNENTTLANNLDIGQYTVAQARANIIV